MQKRQEVLKRLASRSPIAADFRRTVAKVLAFLGAAGIPAGQAAGTTETGSIYRDHQRTWNKMETAGQTAAYLEADLRAAAGRARLWRWDHDR